MRIRAERQSHGRIRARATFRAIADFVNKAYTQRSSLGDRGGRVDDGRRYWEVRGELAVCALGAV